MTGFSGPEKRELLEYLSPELAEEVQFTWVANAREDQLPPEVLGRGEDWLVWLILGGRGALA